MTTGVTDDMTIFDKILDGDIPCHKVYENEHVLAFLDIQPLSRGHTLVIPKQRKCASLHQLSDLSAAELGRALPRICRAVMKATGAESYNILQNNGASAGEVVMHVHFHIIPRFAASGLLVDWRAGSLDGSEAATLTSAIRAAMDSDSP